MALEKDLITLDDQSLIEIIEKPENQGTPYQLTAKKELNKRNLSPEKIKKLAILVNEAIAYNMIMNEDASEEGVSMHKSDFLSEEDIKQIYIQALEKYMKYKDQFRFNVWSYAIGGG